MPNSRRENLPSFILHELSSNLDSKFERERERELGNPQDFVVHNNKTLVFGLFLVD